SAPLGFGFAHVVSVSPTCRPRGFRSHPRGFGFAHVVSVSPTCRPRGFRGGSLFTRVFHEGFGLTHVGLGSPTWFRSHPRVGHEGFGLTHVGLGSATWVSVLLTWVSGKALSTRSEEHTSELQSRENVVCRLLL